MTLLTEIPQLMNLAIKKKILRARNAAFKLIGQCVAARRGSDLTARRPGSISSRAVTWEGNIREVTEQS